MATHSDTEEIERLIMECLRPVVRELLLINPTELIALLQFNKHRDISDLIDSATEQYFAPDFLAYREVGVATLDWHSPLSIELQMVLNSPSHSFEFMLQLQKNAAGVSLARINELPNVSTSKTASKILERAIKVNAI